MSPYICHDLGGEGDDTFLQHLVQVYEESNIYLLNQGFYVQGIFNLKIPTATNLRMKETEEDQLQALVQRKGDFSALSIYANVGKFVLLPVQY